MDTAINSVWILLLLGVVYLSFRQSLRIRNPSLFKMHAFFAVAGAAAIVAALFNLAGADTRSLAVFGSQLLVAVWLAIELHQDKRIYDRDFEAFIKDTGAVSFGETAFVCNSTHQGRDGIYIFWYRGARWFEPGKQFKDGIFHHLTGGEDAKFTAKALELAAKHRV